MRCAVAALLALSLTTSACFPNSKKHSSYAKMTEGGLMLAGILTLAVVNTTADCDANKMLGMEDEADSCRAKADVFSALGLGALLIGLVGFIVTVAVEPDDAKPTPTSEPKTTTPATPAPAETTPATPGTAP